MKFSPIKSNPFHLCLYECICTWMISKLMPHYSFQVATKFWICMFSSCVLWDVLKITAIWSTDMISKRDFSPVLFSIFKILYFHLEEHGSLIWSVWWMSIVTTVLKLLLERCFRSAAATDGLFALFGPLSNSFPQLYHSSCCLMAVYVCTIL